MQHLLTGLLLLFFLLNADAQSPDRPNIILITIDTLRADHLGSYGYAHQTSPNIDRLASKGILFRYAFAPTPLTLPSHASILTGVYPARHGFRDNAFFQSSHNWYLAEALKQSGYKTAAFVSAAPLLSRYGLGRGFDYYEDQFEGNERKADATTQLVIEWLKKNQSSYFLWIHFFDPHAEYEPPKEFAEKHSGRPYDAEIAYADHFIGKLVDSVASDTNWIITADHGESLGEHGEFTHGVFLYNSTLHVPLIIAGPTINKAERTEAVSLCDIAPTILKLAGVETKTKLDGLSLLKPSSDRTLFSESQYSARNFGFGDLYAAIRNRKKYISAPDSEFYDFENDPSEKTNLIKKTNVDPFRKPLDSYREQKIIAKESALFSEDREKLRSLGYVSGQPIPANQSIDPKDRIRWIEEFNSAMALLKRGNLDAAENAFRKLLSTEPKSAMGTRFLANVLAAKSKYDEAAQFYSASLKQHPDPEVAIQLAKTLARLNRPEQAEIQLKEAVQNFPEFSEARFELASLYAGRKQFQEALTVLDPKLNVVDVAEVHNQRGIVLLSKGDFKNAASEFEQASKNREKAQYFNNLGIALRQQKLLEEAERSFLRALELKPSYEEAEVNLCFTFIMSGRIEQAGIRLEKITTKNPRLWLARFALGNVYENSGKQDLALKEYKNLFHEVPANWQQRSQLEAKIKELEQR